MKYEFDNKEKLISKTPINILTGQRETSLKGKTRLCIVVY